MSYRLIVQIVFRSLMLTAVGGMAQTKTQDMDKIIVVTARLDIDSIRAFQLFTQGEDLEQWLTVKADVQSELGGKYELFWEPTDPENNSTLGCKILAIDATNYLNFEWKGPKQFKHFMNTIRPLTNVTVIFNSKEGKTLVTLIHSGWRTGEDWDQARNYFENAWKGAFVQLVKYAATM